MKRVLEKSIQAAAVKYARSKGLVAIKLTTMGRFGVSGWPDYLFLGRGLKTFFIEFKIAGGKTTPLQDERIDTLRGLGFGVYVCDSVELAKVVIDEELA